MSSNPSQALMIQEIFSIVIRTCPHNHRLNAKVSADCLVITPASLQRLHGKKIQEFSFLNKNISIESARIRTRNNDLMGQAHLETLVTTLSGLTITVLVTF